MSEPKHGDTNMCGRCGGPIRCAEGHWIHSAPDYDPFESVHPPIPANVEGEDE